MREEQNQKNEAQVALKKQKNKTNQIAGNQGGGGAVAPVNDPEQNSDDYDFIDKSIYSDDDDDDNDQGGDDDDEDEDDDGSDSG